MFQGTDDRVVVIIVDYESEKSWVKRILFDWDLKKDKIIKKLSKERYTIEVMLHRGFFSWYDLLEVYTF